MQMSMHTETQACMHVNLQSQLPVPSQAPEEESQLFPPVDQEIEIQILMSFNKRVRAGLSSFGSVHPSRGHLFCACGADIC